MSRVSAREGITAYFTNAASVGRLPYVGTIYSGRPVILDETAYTQTMVGQAVQQTANGSSAVLVVNLPKTSRQRRADTGRGAVNDTEIHDVEMEIFFASNPAASQTGLAEGLQAQLDFDGIADTLTDLIRSDPTMGGSSWSAGEYEQGIDLQQSEAFLAPDGMTVCITALLRWQFWLWVAGDVTAP